jgi:uncharacterized protein YneF (UPF0154 family)
MKLKNIIKTEKSGLTEDKQNKKKNLLTIIIVSYILLSTAVGGFFIYQYVQEKKKSDNPIDTLTQQTAEIKKAVAKHLLLNDGVEPSIAKIQDVDSLKKDNPDFYKDAKNNDYILIFPKRAVIYNQQQDIVINVAPIITTPEGTNPNVTETPTTIVPSTTPTVTKTTTKK